MYGRLLYIYGRATYYTQTSRVADPRFLDPWIQIFQNGHIEILKHGKSHRIFLIFFSTFIHTLPIKTRKFNESLSLKNI